MATKFQIKRTSVTGRTPNTTNSGNSSYIDAGELAINLTDGKLFSSNGTVAFEVGANLASLSVNTISVGANVTVNTSSFFVGNSTVNTVITSASVSSDSFNSDYANIKSEANTLSSTTQSQIAAFAVASFRSAKLIVQIYDSVAGEVQVSELLVAHDGTTAVATEYGVVFTGTAALATFDVDVNGGNVRLLATQLGTNSTQYKTLELLMIA